MNALQTVEYSPTNLGRVLAISPHLDDAVFSCGALLEQCRSPIVLTIFAGEPADGDKLTSWDASCGFTSASQAMSVRRHEDIRALSILHAHAIHLGFLDAQYRHPPDIQDIQNSVQQILAREHPDTVFFPLGLFHSDHVLVHCAMATLRHIEPGLRWVAYEDALYRAKPDLVRRRLGQLRLEGVTVTPFATDSGRAAEGKRHAVAAYTSQLINTGLVDCAKGMTSHGGIRLRNDSDVMAPERYWLLSQAA